MNKLILSSSCGESLAIDLISVKHLSEYNKGYIYTLTAIDYIFRNVWAKPMGKIRSTNGVNRIKR